MFIDSLSLQPLHRFPENMSLPFYARRTWFETHTEYLNGLLACIWIENHNSMPPTEFAVLYRDAALSQDLTNEIDDLLRCKMAGDELDAGPQIEILNRFLEEQVGYYSGYGKTMERHNCPVERLDELFLEMLVVSQG
jgi:predicted nucleotidyltransferase